MSHDKKVERFWMMFAALGGAFLVSSCGGGGDSAPAFTCAIGSLPGGSWRWHYTETNGSCGAIADETILPGSDVGTSSCTGVTNQISADRCTVDFAKTCPLNSTTIIGTQTWVGHLVQTAATELHGSATLQAVAPFGSCRSTYSIAVTKL